MIESETLLLDVRSREEFAMDHIAGSKNIPVDVLPRQLADLPSKTQPIVVYCRSGMRSASAVRLLRDAGYLNVTDVRSIDAARRSLHREY
jgi:rhodanese-related sulfurtransferase